LRVSGATTSATRSGLSAPTMITSDFSTRILPAHQSKFRAHDTRSALTRAPDLDQLTGVVRAEDFDPPLALIAGCSVQHMSHSCRLSPCLTSHLPTNDANRLPPGVTPGPS
jgi:hypothetical protein